MSQGLAGEAGGGVASGAGAGGSQEAMSVSSSGDACWAWVSHQ